MGTTALAATAALVSLIFAACTFERWLTRRRPYELTWSIALLTFCLGALALAWGSSAGWNSANFRLFYLFGAIVNVPLLAVGQIELLSRKPWVKHLRLVVVLVAIWATGVLTATPLKAEVPLERLPRGAEVFSTLPRVLAAVGSAGGAAVVFLGAGYSFAVLLRARLRRERDVGGVQPANARVVGTGLITLGTVILSASGTLNKRFGEMTAFAVTLTAGVIVLFFGFVVSSRKSPDREPSNQVASNHLS